MKIYVRDNDVNKALRILKKKLFDEGATKELRNRTHFISKGEEDRLAKKAGIQRWKKKRVKIEQQRVKNEQRAFSQRNNKNKNTKATNTVKKTVA